jgi:hypothetical protein
MGFHRKPPNGWRLSGERKRVRCSRGLDADISRLANDAARRLVGRGLPLRIETSPNAEQDVIPITTLRLLVTVRYVPGEINKHETPCGWIFPGLGTQRNML